MSSQKLEKNLAVVLTNHIVMKNFCQMQGNEMHRDVPVASLCRCAKSCCLDKSDR